MSNEASNSECSLADASNVLSDDRPTAVCERANVSVALTALLGSPLGGTENLAEHIASMHGYVR